MIAAARSVPTADYPGGWPGEIEAALLDAVLSIQARYGSETTGVRASIKRYRAHHAGRPLDDLTVLAGHTEDELQRIIDNRQRVSGRSKAAAVIEAADRLVRAGVSHAGDLDPRNPTHKRAYTAVRGLGPVTWAYFGMCLGKSGIKADTWITRFVDEAVGRKAPVEEATQILLDTAQRLGLDPIKLDYALWYHMRRRRNGAGAQT